MLRDRTLFVVGAGASKEFNFPIGSELATEIAKRLDLRFAGYNDMVGTGDLGLYEAIKSISNGQVNDFLHACWLIRDGIELSYSIDNFIDTHRHDVRVEKCGKLAISKCILDAEKASTLYYDPNHDESNPATKVTDTWVSHLIRLMQNGVPKENVASFFNNSAFIVFNYDRCIEQYFYHALKALYGLSDAESADIMRTAVIKHPYGSVGTLPWQERNELKSVSFGARDSSRVLVPLLPNIKTYTEQIQSEQYIEELNGLVTRANTIVFLGFSYLPQNLNILLRNIFERQDKRVIGTGFGLSTADREIVANSLRVLTPAGSPGPIIEQLKCFELISQYARFLGG